MAINKNFVIKNGVEVNTNLLVGDSTLNKVGIGTTLPEYTLHIGIGAGARGGIGVTDIHVSGIATIGVANSTSAALSVTGISTFEGLVDANGGVSARTAAVQDLTDNRVVIAGSGGELEDSANLTFDGSTLTVSGDLDPTNVSIASTLQVAGVATFLSGTLVSGIGTFESDIDFKGSGGSTKILFDSSQDQLEVADSAAITFGDHPDYSLSFSSGNQFGILARHNGTDDLVIGKTNSGGGVEKGLKYVRSTGEVELYHNDTKIFQTTGIGITVGLSTIQHNGNAAFAGIVTVGGDLVVGGDLSLDEISGRNLILTGIATIPTLGVTGLGTFEKLTVGTGVTLQEHGGVSIAGITTIGGTVGFAASAFFEDDAGIFVGDDLDLKIVHTGGQSRIIDSGSGFITIQSNRLQVNNADNTENMAAFIADGAVELYHNHVKQVETTATGILVGTGVTVQRHGGVSIAGITTIGGALDVDGATTLDG